MREDMYRELPRVMARCVLIYVDVKRGLFARVISEKPYNPCQSGDAAGKQCGFAWAAKLLVEISPMSPIVFQ
jgi:hypothetical protein